MKTTRLLPAPGVPIGYLPSGKPVYPMIGGSEDAFDVEPDGDDPDDSEEEPDDSADSSDGTKEKDKYEPPSRAEWLKVQSSLAKANASAKQRREALAEAARELQQLRDEKAAQEAETERKALLDEVAGKKPKKSSSGGSGAAPTPVLPDGVMTKSQVRQLTAQAAREAEERAADKFRGIAVNQAARAALASSGVQTNNVGRLVKLLDLEDIQIDDNGEITDGLDEQIESLKSELPQLFRPAEPVKPKPRRAPAPRVQSSGREQVEDEPGSSADRMARQILGSR